MKENMRRNIRLIFVIRAFKMFMVSMPVIVIFFQDLGLNYAEIFILQAIFSLGTVLFEVPSGYFADRYTRRLSIILGLWTNLVAWCVYSFAYGFWGLAVAEILLALSISFISGADTATLYDSLDAMGETDANLRQNSRSLAVGAFSEGVAGIIGGLLAVISLRAPLYGQAVVALFAIPFAYMLIEPPHKRDSSQHPWRAIAKVVRHSLHENSGVKWLILYNAGLATMTYTVVWLAQPYYEMAGVAIGWFGVIWFIKHLALATFGWKAENLANRFGSAPLLIALPVVGVCTYLIIALGFSPWLLPAFIGFEAIRGLCRPLISDRIHRLIDSDFRATVESVNGLIARLFFVVFGLGVGGLADRIGLQLTFVVSAAVYAVLLGAMLFAMRKRSILFMNGR